ncbi:hypothetical protein [Chlamydia vaughanii]|uniref:hypothetical protein n=1 Tax=Chlamydia vaughanii TaxID=3112552 RepID=UPI0032B174DC
MSSWLAQSTEILLNQTPYIPDGPKHSESTPEIKYSITLASDSTMLPLAKYLMDKQGKIFSKQQEYAPVVEKQVTSANTREKILQFGSSLNSQLPKKEQASTSSPWNLFSQKSSQESMKALLQDVMMPKNQDQETAKSSTLEGSRFSEPRTKSEEQQKSHQSIFERTEFPKESIKHPESKILSKERSPCAKDGDFLSKKEEKLTLKLLQEKYGKGLSQDEHSGKQQHKKRFFKKTNKAQKERASAIVPIITPPAIGVFTLSYLLTKQGILSDFAAYASYKDSVEVTQKELDATHEERIKQINQSIEREKQEARWGSLLHFVEMVAPWLSIGIGIVAVATGGGVFAWMALLGGLITLTLSLMDSLNGWEKLERYLPGNDKKFKQKILQIVSITLHIIAAVLALITLKIENLGFSPLIEGAMKGIAPAVEGSLGFIRGAMLWIRSRLLRIQGNLADLELKIEILNFERDDYIMRNEELLERMHDSFENLGRVLQLCREIDRTFLESLR